MHIVTCAEPSHNVQDVPQYAGPTMLSAYATIIPCILGLTGGGLNLGDSIEMTLKDCVFTNNTAEVMGGAVQAGSGVLVTIDGGVMEDNKCECLGVAQYTYECCSLTRGIKYACMCTCD